MEALPRLTLFLITNYRLPISPALRLQIAHFSTNQSTSHYPYRRHEEEVRNVGVSVWWDVEICSPPAGSGAFRIVHSITAALRANGIRGPLRISAFGNVVKIPKLTQEALSSTGINLTHVPAGGNNSVSNSMIVELMYWVSQHPPPVHLLLICGNHDMAGILHRLRMSNYNILLAGPEDASTALFSAASIMWSWSDLLRGENLTGKHFNHPPDGPSGSWYGSYRVPLESPFPAVDQPMDARDGEPVESETENTISDIPIEVVEQIRQILILYPKGLSIGLLREELNKSMTLDKNLYGYKKFSNLLLAMPQIFELHRRKDGQHMVCAINPKARSSADSPINASKNSIAGDCNHKAPSTETEVCDDSSSLKSADEIANLIPHLITNGKSKMIEMDHASPATFGEQPSLKRGCQDRCPTSEMDVEVKTIGCDPTAIEKQDNASEHGIYGRTWTKWFGGMSDANMTREGNHSVQNCPSFDSSHNDTTTGKKPEISENFDIEGGRIRKLYSRVLNWFKTDRSEIESSAAGSDCSNISSQAAQDKPVDSDLQKRIECAIESTNQSPAPKASLEFADEKKTRMLADCQKLLDAILKTHPNGYHIRGFKNLFFKRYCYCLDVKYLEFDKLASLINTMSGVMLKGTLKGTMIVPSENSSPNPGSSETGLLDNIDRIGVRTDSDSEMSIPSNSDSYDSQFDEQLGPVRSLNGNLPSGQSGGLKPRTDKKLDRLYKPCAEEDIYTDSDGETQTPDGKGVPKVHNEVSTLMDILSNWEAGKDGASKSKLSEVSVKDSLQNPTKPHSPVEVSRKSSRNIVQKWKPQRTFNFVASDHRKEVDFKSATEPRQQC